MYVRKTQGRRYIRIRNASEGEMRGRVLLDTHIKEWSKALDRHPLKIFLCEARPCQSAVALSQHFPHPLLISWVGWYLEAFPGLLHF